MKLNPLLEHSMLAGRQSAERRLLLELQSHVLEQLHDDAWDISLQKGSKLLAEREGKRVTYSLSDDTVTSTELGPHMTWPIQGRIDEGEEVTADVIIALLEMIDLKADLAHMLPKLVVHISADDAGEAYMELTRDSDDEQTTVYRSSPRDTSENWRIEQLNTIKEWCGEAGIVN